MAAEITISNTSSPPSSPRRSFSTSSSSVCSTSLDDFLFIIFSRQTSNGFYIRFRDLYNAYTDFIADNNIDLSDRCDNKDEFISILTMSLLCTLQSLSGSTQQKQCVKWYLMFMITLLNRPYSLYHSKYGTIFSYMLSFMGSYETDDELRNKIVDITLPKMVEHIYRNGTLYETLTIIDELFNSSDCMNMYYNDEYINCMAIGFYGFIQVTSHSYNIKDLLFTYLSKLLDMNLLCKKNTFYTYSEHSSHIFQF